MKTKVSATIDSELLAKREQQTEMTRSQLLEEALHLQIRQIGNSETNLQAKIALLKALPVDWYVGMR